MLDAVMRLVAVTLTVAARLQTTPAVSLQVKEYNDCVLRNFISG
jgi:hypothetical protein